MIALILLGVGAAVDALPGRICQVIQNKELEQKAVTGVCSMQSKIPAEECEVLLSKVWDELDEKECSGLTALPASVCQVVQNKELEQKAVTGVCSMQSKIPAEECEVFMSKVWD